MYFKAAICFSTAILTTLTPSCRKKPLEDSIIPQITLRTISPLEVRQFQDNILIVLDYSDADGNIGDISPDSASLFILDSRLTEWEGYHVKPLAPSDTKVSIRGTLNIHVNAPFLFGNGGEETMFYAIKIRDQENNWSNIVETPEITIKP